MRVSGELQQCMCRLRHPSAYVLTYLVELIASCSPSSCFYGRRDFATLAWAGVLIAGLLVLMLIPLGLAVGSDDDTPVYVTFIPAVVGVLAIVEAVPG